MKTVLPELVVGSCGPSKVSADVSPGLGKCVSQPLPSGNLSLKFYNQTRVISCLGRRLDAMIRRSLEVISKPFFSVTLSIATGLYI